MRRTRHTELDRATVVFFQIDVVVSRDENEPGIRERSDDCFTVEEVRDGSFCRTTKRLNSKRAFSCEILFPAFVNTCAKITGTE